MKKYLVFTFFVIVFFGTCSLQNVSAQSTNDAQRIVGTWRIEDGDGHFQGTFIFNGNGSFVRNGSSGNAIINGSFFISTNNRLIMRFPANDRVSIFDYYLSTDGRILVLNYGDGNKWLTKQ